MTRRELFAAAAALQFNRKVRVVMLGTEGHPGEIVNPIDRMPDVELAGVCHTDPKALAAYVKGNFRVAKAKQYTDYARMLDAEKPDVVAVCNTNGQRAAAVMEAVRRGHHVIAEKPLAGERREYERLKAMVRDKGVKIGMLLPMRYDPSYRALRRIVDSGAIGEVIQISSQKSYRMDGPAAWKRNRETYVSTTVWIGVHMIDLMAFTSGRKYTHVAGFAGRVGFPNAKDLETSTTLSFRLDNGGTASLHMDYSRPDSSKVHGDDRLRLAGTKGIAEYLAATGVTLLTTGEKTESKVTELPAEGSVFEDFLQHVYNGKPATLTEAEIYAACEATLCADEAVREGKTVAIQS